MEPGDFIGNNRVPSLEFFRQINFFVTRTSSHLRRYTKIFRHYDSHIFDKKRFNLIH